MSDDLVERARKEGSGRGELDGDATDALLLELAAEIERLKAALRAITDLRYNNHAVEIARAALEWK